MTGHFRHQAVLYDSVEGLASAVTPSLRDALSQHDPVVMIMNRANAELLGAALGELTQQLEWLDSSPWQRRMGARFDAAVTFLSDRSAEGRPARIVHDQAPGEELPATLREYLRYEALTNIAFAGFGTPVLCLWDRRRYSASAIESVCRTHPELIRDGGAIRSSGYAEPEDYLAEGDRTLQLVAPEMTEIAHELTALTALAGLRRSLQRWARGWGMGREASEDLAMAVHEVAANAVEYGRPPAEAVAWRESAGLVCEVRDGGTGPRAALAGYLRPPAGQSHGRGLWLARRLADLVEVSTKPPGTRIRLHFEHQPRWLTGR